MGVCVFGLSLILGYIYKPIKDVAQVLKYHMPDNDRMLEEDAEFIKNCMQQYSTSEDVDAALLQIRKSQLHTLHAQISPHLLGNTLDVIKWELIDITGENSKLASSIGALSLFLTESYEYQRMITSIGAEIARTKYYVDMMVYCFFERLQVEWIVDENILNCAIVNLTLQPYIENCIEHGFTREEEDPRIVIRIGESEYHNIYIEIEDNGSGMPEEILDSIKTSLKHGETANKHIGIKNSHLKLKLLFGDDYGVTELLSNENGTYVKLTLPKITAPTMNVP